MKKIGIAVTVLLLAGLVLASESFAQPPMGGRTGRANPGARIYDVNTVQTVAGEILTIETATNAKTRGGYGVGIHLLVKVDKDTLSVHLGPAQFMARQGVKLEVKDRIEVRGSRVTLAGKPTIIAAELKKGDKTARLRDEKGFPLWGGGARRR
ncbi:MAG: DNA-binding protein [Candidatus Eisenbacteria bacterium]|nr:DNA-binding protein [Candidatus Eisenbacteria bacterium]